MDLNTSGLRVRIIHTAECPGVSAPDCAVYDIPPHTHDQSISWLRLDPTLNMGLGKGFQVSVTMPLDLRVLTVDYYTSDGATYDPPYGDIHHRDETLYGIVDPRVYIQRFMRPNDGLILGGGLGVTVPLGQTEDDPFALGSEGEYHQHMQFGTGVFTPLARGTLVWSHDLQWGLFAWGGGQLPLYANDKGYQPAATLDLGAGPTFRPTPKWQLLPSIEGTLEGPEYWSGTAYNGRFSLLTGATVLYSPKKDLVFQGQARTTLLQRERGNPEGEGQILQRLILTLGLSWRFSNHSEE